MSALQPELNRAAIDAKLVSLTASVAIAIAVSLTGFVQNEPAPYELYMAVLMPVWALFGLAISRATAPLLALLVLFNIGGMVSMTQMADLQDTPLYLAVSFFLALTAVFFAGVLSRRWQLYGTIFGAWLVAALFTASLGILGYFGLIPGAETFTLYDRASGGFKDPNVFGPFLVLPAIWLLHGMLTGSLGWLALRSAGFALLTLAIFLSFSRGAWGLYAFSAATLLLALFLTAGRNTVRLRIVVMALIGLHRMLPCHEDSIVCGPVTRIFDCKCK